MQRLLLSLLMLVPAGQLLAQTPTTTLSGHARRGVNVCLKTTLDGVSTDSLTRLTSYESAATV